MTQFIPIRVRIIEDCREGKNATGQYGMYLGDFPVDILGDNPFIRLDDGTGIWGYQCWWRDADQCADLEQEQTLLEEHKREMWRSFAYILRRLAPLFVAYRRRICLARWRHAYYPHIKRGHTKAPTKSTALADPAVSKA